MYVCVRVHVRVRVCAALLHLLCHLVPADSENYPHMRTLLLFDTREFLNVLTLVSHPLLVGAVLGFPQQ